MSSYYARNRFNRPVTRQSLLPGVINDKDAARLKNIRRDYGNPPKMPQPADFGLTHDEMGLIETFNQKIHSFNRRWKIIKNLVMFLVGAPVYILGFYIVTEDWTAIWAFWGIALAGVIGDFCAKKIVRSPQPLHNQTSAVNSYNTLIAGYSAAVNDYPRLMALERSDFEVKAKENFWLSLSGFEFEKEIAALYSKLGYAAIKTRNTGDGGIDIILNDKQGKKTVVQCKAHKNAVGPHVVRDLFGVMTSEKAGGILINLGGFTQGVADFAQGKGIQLVDITGVLALQERVANGGTGSGTARKS